MDIKIEKKKGLRGVKPTTWAYIAGAAILIGACAWLATSDLSSTLRVDSRGIKIAQVEQGRFDDFVRVDGRVQPISVVQISAEEGGIVREMVVEEGSYVHKGDVIARLSNSNLDLQILNAEAELAEKQNILRNTQISMEQDRLTNRNERAQLDLEVVRKRRAYEQQERLYQEKLNTREEYLQAKEDYELALKKHELVVQRLEQDSIYRLSQMDQMEENLDNMRKNVLLIRERKNQLNVISPIDGELGLLDVELGQNIGAGYKVGQINDLSNYKVQANIDEHYIDRVQTGLTATVERNGVNYEMRVRKVYPEVRDGKFKTDLVFDGERPENIRTGQSYFVNLQLGQSTDAILIPKGTFFSSTAGKWIFVLDSSGKKAYRRTIRLGRQNINYYEVLDGLEPGEQVIVNGYESFGDKKVISLN